MLSVRAVPRSVAAEPLVELVPTASYRLCRAKVRRESGRERPCGRRATFSLFGSAGARLDMCADHVALLATPERV